MFGLQIVTKKKLAQIKSDAEDKALSNLVELLKKKDKIFVEPVTMFGDHQKVTDCVFFGLGGTALTIISPNDHE